MNGLKQRTITMIALFVTGALALEASHSGPRAQASIDTISTALTLTPAPINSSIAQRVALANVAVLSTPIWQPPTRTPNPSSGTAGPAVTTSAAASGESPFEPTRLWQALWNGVSMALGAFGLLAVYIVIRAAHRGELRRWLWEFRREVVNPLLNRRVKK